jgi:hypothetical protein
MYLVINNCVTAVKVSNFSGHYLRNRSEQIFIFWVVTPDGVIGGRRRFESTVMVETASSFVTVLSTKTFARYHSP